MSTNALFGASEAFSGFAGSKQSCCETPLEVDRQNDLCNCKLIMGVERYHAVGQCFAVLSAPAETLRAGNHLPSWLSGRHLPRTEKHHVKEVISECSPPSVFTFEFVCPTRKARKALERVLRVGEQGRAAHGPGARPVRGLGRAVPPGPAARKQFEVRTPGFWQSNGSDRRA